ncbi:TetR family transcriptional regulator [Nakamurella sp. YIM 132087]|uniref:TetR family transcriptional regulator n=1 Tax=Nakamurella alba TaxID=2665158 RepID=A0A7K1FNX9_9ACTN|nr:TetR/AcrR family transcriptional regulator [Nakamurella alba]MTD15857.1 TetR family transcriptional regulator [Nakamurella alba]
MSAAPDPADAGARRYHHGNLAAALVDAGFELARTGGPDAVVLREAARRVGVSAAAAYRHFAGHAALRLAVKERAMQELGAQMAAAASAALPAGAAGDPAAEIGRFAALGRTYLDFALRESGLFGCICAGIGEEHDEGSWTLDSATPAFGVAFDLLGQLVDAGVVPEQFRRSGALVAWAAVHGLAMLTLAGPLADFTDDQREALYDDAVHILLQGLMAR